MKQVCIWTDGACSGNPGPGGYAVLIQLEGHPETRKEFHGGTDERTTNNVMELTATIQALKALKEPCSVTLNSDSEYVIKGMNERISGWQKNGWRTKSGPVANQDVWLQLLEVAKPHRICWICENRSLEHGLVDARAKAEAQSHKLAKVTA